MTTAKATRAAIYVRISQDRGGAGLGVARQEADCRALCAQKGWDVVDVYPDNDVSAYSGAPRPKWQELLGFVGSYEDMLARWERMNPSQERAVISSAVRAVHVLPANPRKRWDPDRFVIDWIA
ncbi:recombinase family protein [Streptomyces sp. NPDC000405]|uniref:recombinase family protein n=1 Tax=Streptomyces sp. NPDC000405 TaxID=3161033 RepID=UPI00398D5388